MSDAKFIDGLIVKAPHERAPEYVKAKLSIKNTELIAFLQERLARGEEWTNADIKVSQQGKWYAAVDDWKPEGKRQESPAPQRQTAPAGRGSGDFADDDINF